MNCRASGLTVIDAAEVTAEEKQWLDSFFLDQIFPVLTPMAMTRPIHFPSFRIWALPSCSTAPGRRRPPASCARRSTAPDGAIPAPAGQGDTLSAAGERRRHVSRSPFPGFSLVALGYFRMIRDSEMEIEEEAEDLVRLFESALKRRRRGTVIRLEANTAMAEDLLTFIVDELSVKPEDVFLQDGLLGLASTSKLIVDDRPDLKFSPYNARFPERIRDFGGDCFARHPTEGHHRPPSL